MEKLTFSSFAKINMGLHLLGKRDDGYHDIQTVFQEIDFHDTLILNKSSSIQLTCTDPDLSTGRDNLVYRAFEIFRDRLGISEGLSAHIEKRIPTGSGLGGGSSNAACTLIAANRLWGHPYSQAELAGMAAEIGSDVPFFIFGGTALGEGRGEKVRPMSIRPDWWIVLICPDVKISTAWAYQEARIALTKEEKFTNLKAILDNTDPRILQKKLVNDLEDVVFQRHPRLKTIKEQLYQRDAFYASMSGSGSSLFGLFNDRERAEKTRAFFSREGLSAVLCRPISSHPFGSVD